MTVTITMMMMMMMTMMMMMVKTLQSSMKNLNILERKEISLKLENLALITKTRAYLTCCKV